VAPVALHPDALLSQMLMASTYPTEVVQAARWVRDNAHITGQALSDAMQKQPWDPSVKALTGVPQVLQMMSDKLDWTQQLGDAFLSQQKDLLAAVQHLRQRAEASGHLKSTEKQTVKKVAKAAGSGTISTIAIEPVNPEFIYVPVYDPGIVYGEWPYPAYEPFYWYPAGFTGTGILSFVAGVGVGYAIWGHLDWFRGRVDIDVDRYNRFNRTNIVDKSWRHDPRHRRNVPYRDPKVAHRFGDAGRTAARDAYRGKAEAGRRDLAKVKHGKSGAKVKQRANKTRHTAKHAKHGAKGRSSAARAKSAARHTGHAAGRRQRGRPSAAAHGYRATRAPQGRAYRSMGGGPRFSSRGGGGPRFGGGGRGGGRVGGGRGGRR
jgi:hypothetical protein